MAINPLNAELNPICHLLALLGTHHIFHVSWLRLKLRGSGYLWTVIRNIFQHTYHNERKF